jgi:hypothetical protein
VRADLLSFEELAMCLCAREKKNVESLQTTKEEEEESVDVAPHWGEPRISCVDVLCAMLLMLIM